MASQNPSGSVISPSTSLPCQHCRGDRPRAGPGGPARQDQRPLAVGTNPRTWFVPSGQASGLRLSAQGRRCGTRCPVRGSSFRTRPQMKEGSANLLEVCGFVRKDANRPQEDSLGSMLDGLPDEAIHLRTFRLWVGAVTWRKTIQLPSPTLKQLRMPTQLSG